MKNGTIHRPISKSRIICQIICKVMMPAADILIPAKLDTHLAPQNDFRIASFFDA